MGLFKQILQKGAEKLVEKGKEKLPEIVEEHLSFDNTRAVASKIKNDIKVMARVIDVFVQLFFIGYYIYSVVTHIDSPIYLGIYASLLGISSIYFIFHLITLGVKAARFKRFKRRVIKKFITYIKIFIQACTIGFGIYELATSDATNIKLIMVIFTGTLFLFNIIIQIITLYFDKSVDMLEVAMEMDSEHNTLLKMVKKSNPFTPEKAGMSDKEVDKYEEKINKEREEYFSNK